MLNNHSFCILPFIHLHVDEDDNIKPCCYANPLKKYTDKFDFNTDSALQQIRNKMLSGEPVAQCQNCYNVEKNNGESYRIRDTKEWLEKLNIDVNNVTTDLIYYDIRNDNLCNLSCRICHPGASSQLKKEYKTIGWPINPASRQVKLSEIVDYQKIKKLYVAGGEPTIMPEFKKFLQKAIDSNNTGIELRIITNATNINKEILKLLSHFKNVEFIVSIDGYDQINKYIRWPADWTSIVNNTKSLFQLTDRVSFNITVSIWNVSNVSQLVVFLENNFTKPLIMLNEAVPTIVNIRPFNFPNKELALQELNKLKGTQSYQFEAFFKNKVDYLIQTMLQSTVNINDLKKFFEYNDKLDQVRNIKLIDYIPELDQCRKLIEPANE